MEVDPEYEAAEESPQYGDAKPGDGDISIDVAENAEEIEVEAANEGGREQEFGEEYEGAMNGEEDDHSETGADVGEEVELVGGTESASAPDVTVTAPDTNSAVDTDADASAANEVHGFNETIPAENASPVQRAGDEVGESIQPNGIDEDELDEDCDELEPLAPITLTTPSGKLYALFQNDPEGDEELPVLCADKEDEFMNLSLLDLLYELRLELEKWGEELDGEMVIVEKLMNLSMGEVSIPGALMELTKQDDVNLQHITLVDLLTVHEGCGLPIPVAMFVDVHPHRFITRFEAIKREIQKAAEEHAGENADEDVDAAEAAVGEEADEEEYEDWNEDGEKRYAVLETVQEEKELDEDEDEEPAGGEDDTSPDVPTAPQPDVERPTGMEPAGAEEKGETEEQAAAAVPQGRASQEPVEDPEETEAEVDELGEHAAEEAEPGTTEHPANGEPPKEAAPQVQQVAPAESAPPDVIEEHVIEEPAIEEYAEQDAEDAASADVVAHAEGSAAEGDEAAEVDELDDDVEAHSATAEKDGHLDEDVDGDGESASEGDAAYDEEDDQYEEEPGEYEGNDCSAEQPAEEGEYEEGDEDGEYEEVDDYGIDAVADAAVRDSELGELPASAGADSTGVETAEAVGGAVQVVEVPEEDELQGDEDAEPEVDDAEVEDREIVDVEAEAEDGKPTLEEEGEADAATIGAGSETGEVEDGDVSPSKKRSLEPETDGDDGAATKIPRLERKPSELDPADGAA